MTMGIKSLLLYRVNMKIKGSKVHMDSLIKCMRIITEISKFFNLKSNTATPGLTP
jgi:hypothetical protein